MKIQTLRTILFLTGGLIAAAQTSHAGDQQKFEVTIPEGDKISIRVPNQWTHSVIQPEPTLPPTVTILSPTKTVSIQITFLPDPRGFFTTKESVDRAVTNANQRYVEGSVEKKTNLIQLESKIVRGCYAAYTDAAVAAAKTPEKGEYAKVASGVFVIRKQGAVFTVLSNDTTGDDYKLAFRTITEHIIQP